MNDKSGAYGLWGLELVKHGDFMSLFCQSTGRCEVAHSSLDDGDTHSYKPLSHAVHIPHTT
ncbi:MAG: hypothetical protein ABF254_11920 [Octadecabacter sp.]